MVDPVPGPILERRGQGHSGLYVPRWALVAGGLIIALVSGSFGAAQKIVRAEERINTMDERLCRLEHGMALLLDRQQIVHNLGPARSCGPRQ